MTKTIVTCDECGTERGEENHWFTMSVKMTISYANVLMTQAYADDVSANQRDVCGRECGQKVFERWMSTGSIEKQPPSTEPPNDTLSTVKPEGETSCR